MKNKSTISLQLLNQAAGTSIALGLGLALMTGVAAVSSAQTIIPTPTALFTFDDATAGTTLATNTAITNSGTSDTSGAVWGNTIDVTANGISGNGLTNFKTTFDNSGEIITAASNASFATGITNPLHSRSATLSIWAKNPGTVTTQDRFVLFGVGNNGNGVNQGLQVWLGQVDETGQRTLNVTLQTWYGGLGTWSSAPLTWDADAWYNVALTWNNTTGAHGHVDLFLTKQTDTFGTPLLSFNSNDTTGSNSAGVTRDDGTGIANGSWVYFGGQGRQYNTGVLSGGGLGTAAIIDDAAAWIGTKLTAEELAANFALHAITGNIPEPRTLAALCGFAGLVAAIVIRRRR
ncbi:MAG: hypothetical protein LBK99_13550 [Opitutaceae bacterium]|jgi:hypothetical protein|nr:hypothetical protein [Opitutaceae bacterium]